MGSWFVHSVPSGCYVPGGRYPLPSTLLMTVIPAQVAGVKNIRVVSPHPAQATLAAAALLGVREFYRVGGAQAIAALAYGTKTISRVDKIVGPGNLFVTVAKKFVAFDCAIDMLAGPTEGAHFCDDGEPRSLRQTWLRKPSTIRSLGASGHAIAKVGELGFALCDFPVRREIPIAQQALRKHGADFVGRFPRDGDRVDKPDRAGTCNHHAQESSGHRAMRVPFSSVTTPRRPRRLWFRTQSRPADRRRCPLSWQDLASATSSR